MLYQILKVKDSLSYKQNIQSSLLLFTYVLLWYMFNQIMFFWGVIIVFMYTLNYFIFFALSHFVKRNDNLILHYLETNRTLKLCLHNSEFSPLYLAFNLTSNFQILVNL